jgi:hypothetical protein
LIADLTARLSAHPRDAVAVLRQLADAAARQPAVPLGPVEYSQIKSWELDLDRPLQYNLNYASHETRTSWAWQALDGSSLDYFTVPGGKYDTGSIPLHQNGPSPAARARFAWYDPAALPSDTTALRSHLVNGPDARGGAAGGGIICTVTASLAPSGASASSVAPTPSCGPAPRPALVPDPATNAIVFGAEDLMRSEPLPPAVRAGLLRVLADAAARGLPNAHFIDMGTVADRAGHAGVAIGYASPDSGPPDTQSHLEVLVFDPATGALLGDEDAYCKGLASGYPAAGSCTPEGYDQILQVKAVQQIPAAPKLPPVPRWTPTTPQPASPR